MARRAPSLAPPAAVWAELLASADELTLARARRPELFVVGGNYRGLFSHLAAHDFRGTGIRVLAPEPTFRDRRDEIPSDISDKLVGVVGEAAQLWIPILGLVVAAGDLVAAVVREHLGRHQSLNPAEVLAATVRAATSECATVMLFEDVTAPGRSLVWKILLYAVTQSPDQELLLVVGANGPQDIHADAGRDPLEPFAPVMKQVRAAVDATPARATYRWVAPLSAARANSWIGPLDAELARRLVSVSGGDDAQAEEWWNEWVQTGQVQRDAAGQWVRTAVDAPMEAEIESVLLRRLGDSDSACDELRVARRALELAALSGRTFSGDAIGAVLAASEPGITSERVGDLIDELTDCGLGDPWLVRTVESVRVPTADGDSWRWLYSFASAEIARYLRAGWHLANEQPLEATASQMLAALRQLNGDHPLFDRCAYELANAANDDLARGTFAARLEHAAHHRQCIALALALLANPGADPLSLDDMILVIDDLLPRGAFALAVAVGKRAVSIVDDGGGSATQRAQSHLGYGEALAGAGQVALSITHLELAVGLWVAMLEETPANAFLRRQLAITLAHLGSSQRLAGKDGHGVDVLRRSADELRTLTFGDSPAFLSLRSDLAVVLTKLGVSLMSEVDWVAAVVHLTEAVDVHRQLVGEDRSNPVRCRELALSLGALGKALCKGGQPTEAIKPIEESIGLCRELLALDPANPDHAKGLAIGLVSLGDTLQKIEGRNPSEAVEILQDGVGLFRALHEGAERGRLDLAGLAGATASLAVALANTGDTSEADSLFSESISAWTELSAREPANKDFQVSLARVQAWSQGLPGC